MRAGFSLLELSIVLVIIGLLAGGVMTGQSLIRAAELRAVSTEFGRFTTAFNAFRDKYQAVPGDFKMATSFWGDDSVACASAATADGTPGTCNGNGDGRINLVSGASATGEVYQLWKQLALSGLLEGTYTGVAGALGAGDAIIGTNVPASKLTNGAWSTSFSASTTGDTSAYGYNYQNFLLFGSYYPNNSPMNAILKPEEAWNLDSKLDDGKPGQGIVIARYWNDACATSSSNTDYTGSYKLTSSTTSCALYFVRAY